MGVNPLGTPDVLMGLTDADDRIQIVWRHRDGDDLLNAHRAGRIQCSPELIIFQIIQVTMGLDDRTSQHGDRWSLFLAHRGQQAFGGADYATTPTAIWAYPRCTVRTRMD